MNEELDSQLSAMFDDELPAAECELLARRLSRDEALKARWSRYAVIGAVIRAERGVVLQSAVAGRVNAALTHEPRLEAAAPAAAGPRDWVRLAAGAGLAAGVAAVSILWLRSHALGTIPMVGVATVASTVQPAGAPLGSSTADSFVVPPVPLGQPIVSVPPMQLADYVVAHSAYSWPISRGSLLSSLMESDAGTLNPSAVSDQRASGVHGHANHLTR